MHNIDPCQPKYCNHGDTTPHGHNLAHPRNVRQHWLLHSRFDAHSGSRFAFLVGTILLISACSNDKRLVVLKIYARGSGWYDHGPVDSWYCRNTTKATRAYIAQ